MSEFAIPSDVEIGMHIMGTYDEIAPVTYKALPPQAIMTSGSRHSAKEWFSVTGRVSIPPIISDCINRLARRIEHDTLEDLANKAIELRSGDLWTNGKTNIINWIYEAQAKLRQETHKVAKYIFVSVDLYTAIIYNKRIQEHTQLYTQVGQMGIPKIAGAEIVVFPSYGRRSPLLREGGEVAIFCCEDTGRTYHFMCERWEHRDPLYPFVFRYERDGNMRYELYMSYDTDIPNKPVMLTHLSLPPSKCEFENFIVEV